MLVIFIVIVMMLSSCNGSVDGYYCQFTNYDGGDVSWEIIDSYDIDKSTMIVTIIDMNGYNTEVDLEKTRIMCIEMEEIEWQKED